MKPSPSAAYAAVTAARARHDEDAAALNLARARVAEARAALDRLASDDADAIARHARRLESAARAGKSGPLPQLAPSDRHVAEEIAARRTLQAAQQMLSNLEAADRESSRALAAAEEALRDAALDTIGREDAARLAAELMQAESRVEEIKALLTAVREVPGIGPHLPVNVHVALRDDLNTPINQIPARGDFARPVNEVRVRPTPAAAAAHWRDRLAALTGGEGADPPATDVAA